MRKCAVIMAGGSGTRLWPLSRRARPKQLLRIIDGRSLIQHAFERLSGLLAPGDIYVIALAEHLPAISRELPDLPPGNLIGEPMGRDTAAAIATSAAILHAQDPGTVMAVFTADHLIRPADRFVAIVRKGFDTVAADGDALVTFGIRPTEPHAGLGYVRRGPAVAPGVWKVEAFHEKPDVEAARGFVASGEYYWNSGMFVWRTETILREMDRYLPATCDAARKVAPSRHDSGAMGKAYEPLVKISIDHAVMEKASHVLVVEMDLEWRDVGSWTALPGVARVDDQGNAIAAANVLAVDASGNIFVSEDDHLIAAIGVEDIVVVRSGDATLICRRDQVQRIKDLVAELERRYGPRYT